MRARSPRLILSLLSTMILATSAGCAPDTARSATEVAALEPGPRIELRRPGVGPHRGHVQVAGRVVDTFEGGGVVELCRGTYAADAPCDSLIGDAYDVDGAQVAVGDAGDRRVILASAPNHWDPCESAYLCYGFFADLMLRDTAYRGPAHVRAYEYSARGDGSFEAFVVADVTLDGRGTGAPECSASPACGAGAICYNGVCVGDAPRSYDPVARAIVRTGCRTFPEVGRDVCGRLHQYWTENGGLPVFGYPIAEARREALPEGTFLTQWFQRNRLELHPELARPYDVLLGRLGAELGGTRLGPRGAPPAPLCEWLGPSADQGNWVCGEVLGYWHGHGLDLGDGGAAFTFAESLALFGWPTSPEERWTDPATGVERTVQWFERARLERHEEHRGTPWYVLGGLLGCRAAGAAPGSTPGC